MDKKDKISKTQLDKNNKQKENAKTLSVACTESLISSALTIQSINAKMPDLDMLVKSLDQKVKQVNSGDLSDLEKMLTTQAHTLDAIFHNMMQRAGGSEFISQLQTYSAIALKAQSQCRNTLATLVELKNPKRATFIKQQNLAINQQINNQTEQENSKKIKNLTNELLIIEEKNYETLDSNRAFTPSAINSQMATLEVSGRKN